MRTGESPYRRGYTVGSAGNISARHSYQSGMFVLAGFLVLGAIATYLTPAKLVNR